MTTHMYILSVPVKLFCSGASVPRAVIYEIPKKVVWKNYIWTARSTTRSRLCKRNVIKTFFGLPTSQSLVAAAQTCCSRRGISQNDSFNYFPSCIFSENPAFAGIQPQRAVMKQHLILSHRSSNDALAETASDAFYNLLGNWCSFSL